MNTTYGPRALVVGLGIGGIATAVRLRSIGWTPVLIEKSPQRRTGGYFLGLSGAGRSAVKRLGMLHDRSPMRPHADFDRAGNKRLGADLRSLPGLPWQMVRGDIEKAAFDALPSDIEIRYSNIPAWVEQDDDGVDVTLTNTADGTSTTERFDLVVGADELRSTVRSLVLGPHERYLPPAELHDRRVRVLRCAGHAGHGRDRNGARARAIHVGVGVLRSRSDDPVVVPD